MFLKRRSFLKKAGLGLAVTSASVGATGLSATGLSTPASAGDTYKWGMTTTWPKNFPGLGTAAERMATDIKKASHGRMEIKVYGAGEIVPAFDALDAVSSGTVEMGHGAPYYWKGKVPAMQFLASMPFGLTAQEQNAWLDFGGGQELADKIYDSVGCKFLAAGNTGVQLGGWYNREIKTVDDFDGLKIRMPGLGGAVLQDMGATVVNLPGGELLQAMQSGTIDAIEWVGPYNDVSFGIHRVAKHYYCPGWHEPAAILDCFINKTAWASLPDDLKAIVTMAAKSANQYALNEFTAQNAKFLSILKEKHKMQPKIFAPDLLAEMKTRAEKVLSTLAAQDPLSKTVYNSVKTFQKQVSVWSNLSEGAYLQARG